MSQIDARGCRISGATPAALQAYEDALAAFQGWRNGADALLAGALHDAPGFVMAHVLRAYLLLCSRDPRRVRAARPLLARAAELPANERERLHLAAIGAALADDFERARARLGEVLSRHPRDVLALQVAHSFDYAIGDAAVMNERTTAVLPAWSDRLPGHSSVLAMHAFGLVETGEYERAEDAARAALALSPADARAHHVMAHVFEMTERPDAGVRWMNEHAAHWGANAVASTHCWWHLALFHLAQRRPDQALRLYDLRVRAGPSGEPSSDRSSERSSELSDLIDASALLWRLQLHGADAGARWHELAAAWAPALDDTYCSFSDLHAMLAFVGARDWSRARRLEQVLARSQALSTRHAETTRQLGLPACRALIAFGQGEHALAITLLASLPAVAHRLGGSHAQRDVLHLTLQHSIDRLRRPARRTTAAAHSIGAAA